MGMAPIETDPRNPYAAPRAELDLAPHSSGTLPANIAGAVAGHYDFTVGDVMDEAWKLVKGMKGAFWGAGILIGIVYLVVDTLASVFIRAIMGGEPSLIVSSLYNGLVGALLTPLVMGMHMMCVRRALGQPISFSTAFEYFSKFGTALAAGLLVTLFTYLGLLALIIPGIYLAVAYEMTIQLVGDQNLSASDAMKTSRKAIAHKWWAVFGLGLLVALLTALSALALLIPLIWTIPWMMMTTGVLYRRIFYATGPAPATEPSPIGGGGPPPVSPGV
jgi:hypothetical protein